MSNQALSIPVLRQAEPIEDRQTAVTKARYDRVARFYDLMQGMMDRGTGKKHGLTTPRAPK